MPLLGRHHYTYLHCRNGGGRRGKINIEKKQPVLQTKELLTTKDTKDGFEGLLTNKVTVHHEGHEGKM